MLDTRFSNNPLVLGWPSIRAYFGTVLEPAPDMRLGALCVIDTKPQTYPEPVKASLKKIGKAIAALLVSHREKLELRDASREASRLADDVIEMNAHLQNSMARTASAEAAKSEFLATITHELRTPLTSIKGALSLLNGGVDPASGDSAKRMIAIAMDNAERLHTMIDEILLLQTATAEERPSSKTQGVDLGDLSRAATENFEALAAGRDISLTVTDEASPCCVKGDRKQLERVMANLLSNAVKYSKVGGHINVQLTRSDDGVQVDVIDDGEGIPDESEDKVFGLFSQVDGSATRAHGGSGIGLYICQKILKAHGATIGYTSAIGRGTTFTVKFPKLVLEPCA
ncbi:sensor histidine kinase [Albirhodobacter sp. R86504]|uniref:sensor histidine kinase n=1 Tax=Albirhodobacter sp. R86504 TaxID=3093848 RepID=UPI00366C4B11